MSITGAMSTLLEEDFEFDEHILHQFGQNVVSIAQGKNNDCAFSVFNSSGFGMKFIGFGIRKIHPNLKSLLV